MSNLLFLTQWAALFFVSEECRLGLLLLLSWFLPLQCRVSTSHQPLLPRMAPGLGTPTWRLLLCIVEYGRRANYTCVWVLWRRGGRSMFSCHPPLWERTLMPIWEQGGFGSEGPPDICLHGGHPPSPAFNCHWRNMHATEFPSISETMTLSFTWLSSRVQISLPGGGGDIMGSL